MKQRVGWQYCFDRGERRSVRTKDAVNQFIQIPLGLFSLHEILNQK